MRILPLTLQNYNTNNFSHNKVCSSLGISNVQSFGLRQISGDVVSFSSLNKDQIERLKSIDTEKGEPLMSNNDKYFKLRDEFGNKLSKVQYETELAAWNFYTNSSDENLNRYTESQETFSNLFKDEAFYAQLKEVQSQGLDDKHLAKQLKDLVKAFYNEIESGNELKALRDKENDIASKYNAYVMKIDGNPVSKAEIMKILETEKNVSLRKKAYEANVNAGDVIADDLVELVKMRNEYAKTKGYDNYFDYMVEDTYEISPEKLDKLLNGVYDKIKTKSFEFEKERQDKLAHNFGVDSSDLMDYHFGFLPDENPEKVVNDYIKDGEQVVELAKNVYKNMGYDVDNMGITLDLFPRKNKNTHGFAFCIEPGKDARILANLTNNTKSLDTIMHELGHCVYDIGLDTSLPFIEQSPSSSVMTEAVAMMMGDLPKMENMLAGTVPQFVLENFKAELKKDDAKFVSRSLQIIEFEREMYKNPDQDLKVLWKNLKQKYLFRGENTYLNNEWATIPHYLSHPGYYQNYFRAALYKAQLYNTLKNHLGNITENSQTAEFLNKNLFKYGASMEDEDLIERITGKTLSEDDFCSRIIK